MIILEAATQAPVETTSGPGIFDLLIGLGGSLIVAIVSVTTIVLSNRNARKLKLDDYKREELDTAAKAVEAARAAIEQVETVHSRVRSLRGQEIASRQNELTRKKIGAAIDKFTELRSAMEGSLLRVSITNPYQDVRQASVMLDDAVTIAFEKGLVHWKQQFDSDTFHTTITDAVDLAKECFRTFRAAIYWFYHKEKYTPRSIRKSDILEKDKKIKAATIALDRIIAKHAQKEDGKDE